MQSRYLTDEELVLISSKMDILEWLPFAISLETGMRIDDVLRIRQIDITRSGKISYIAEKTGKHGNAQVSETTAKLLWKMATNNRDSQWVFASRVYGKHLTRQACWYRIKRACVDAGISPAMISPHSMRKNAAVRCYRERGIQATQEMLQHDRIDTTEIYALSDYLDKNTADEPMKRGDLSVIARLCVQLLKLGIANGD